MSDTIVKGMLVVAKSDKYSPPLRIGTVLGVHEGQYQARGKTFARIAWTYQYRYLATPKGTIRRGWMQTKALRLYQPQA